MPADKREKTAANNFHSSPAALGLAVSEKEKREALEEVLQSERFFRAEQLRKFLRYICEMELAGRGGELCEALIGVEALGRPADYTPTEDASVRRRAADLREKLHYVYATELAAVPVRIALPKGKYIPRFVRVERESSESSVESRPAPSSSSAKSDAPEESQEPVESALSLLPERNGVAKRLDPGAMQAARYEPGTAWRPLAILWLSVGWVLGGLTVAAGFTLALWLWPARTKTTSPHPAVHLPVSPPVATEPDTSYEATASPRPAVHLPASPPVATEPDTSYEAEAPNNTFSRSVRADRCGWCSGGGRVRHIGKSPLNYLVINDIHVKKAGSYEMAIFYVLEGMRDLFIRVNDGHGPVTKLQLTGNSWREVAKVSVTVQLAAGSNKVKFYNDFGYAPDIDRIVIR